jgi:hypothetical protein
VFTVAPDTISPFFKITATGAGSSSLVVIDAHGNEACASVEVHTATIVGQGRRKGH